MLVTALDYVTRISVKNCTTTHCTVLPKQNRLSAFHEILLTQGGTSKLPHTILKKKNRVVCREPSLFLFFSMVWGGVFDPPLLRLSLIFARKSGHFIVLW